MILDNDLYKFTMQQAIYHQFPFINVEYKFKCRNDAKWTDKHVQKIKDEINNLCNSQLSADDIQYLESIRFFKPDYIDFLSTFKLDNCINIFLKENQLNVIIKGNWLTTILFEVPVLAIINEVYFNNFKQENLVEGKTRLDKKIELLKSFRQENPGFHFIDFGTRRRYGFIWHDYVIKRLVEENVGLIGSSNILMARKYRLKPIGTMAHEWLQAGQALTQIQNSQRFMFQKWVDEYNGDLGIALSDVLGVKSFLKDFDLHFALLYQGVRHDSGDPFDFADKIIRHYVDLNINPKTKTIVFSDGLDFLKAFELYKEFSPYIKCSFGIGTNLTNDMGIEPLQIVIKMAQCNGQPVAKISDSPGKGMCEDEIYLAYLKHVFNIQ